MKHFSVVALSALSSAALAAQPADFTVDTTLDTQDAMPGDGLCADMAGMCSLRAAIQEANALGGASVIDLAPGASYGLDGMGAGEDLGATGDLDVSAMIRLQGMGANIDGLGLDRVFDVMPGAALWLSDVTLTGGAVTDASGGAIRSAGDLRLVDAQISGSSALGVGASGGAVFNDAGTTLILRATLSGNASTRAGGAVEANAGQTVIGWSDLSDNTTGDGPGNGGAFHLTGAGSVAISYSTISGNVAGREGGGVWNSATGFMTLDACTITDNDALGMAADDGGGGVFNDGGVLVISDSTITDNRAMMGSGSGGGVFNQLGDVTIWTTTIARNTSARAGGGVEANLGATTIVDSTLRANTTGNAPGNGGGLHLTGAGDVLLDGVTVVGNAAGAEGGGVWNSATGTMTITASRIGRNVAHGAAADQGGGGVFNDGGSLAIDTSLIAENVADGAAGSGGGVFNNLGSTVITSTELRANVSMRAGGGVEANVGWTSLEGCLLTGNRTGAAPGNGGGLHLTGAGTVEITGSGVRNNTAAAEGGGLWNSPTGTMTVTRTRVTGNMAPLNPDNHNEGGAFSFNGNVVPPTP